jgi:hypothetical protein
MEPNLHGLCPLNCQDLLSWLPSNLAFFILSFLDPGNLLCYWDTFCFQLLFKSSSVLFIPSTYV